MVPNENVRLSGELVNSHPPLSDNLRDLRLRKTILKSDDNSVLSQEIFQKTDSINVSLLLPLLGVVAGFLPDTNKNKRR